MKNNSISKVILAGSLIIDLLLIVFLVSNVVVFGRVYVIEKMCISIIVLLYLVVVSYFIAAHRPKVGAWMLISLYAVIGLTILHMWGINAPVGVLILGFVIFLASVMLGARYIIYVTIALICFLIILQFLNSIGVSQPDNSILSYESNYGDVICYAIIFCIFAMIAWISGRKMENALQRAIKAEKTLEKERDELAAKVNEQTKSLITAQQKELKQLYKFAELGQLTTIILHELANYLSILTLDIDDLNERHENSVAMKHAKESIFYIDTIIDQVRNQITESDNSHKFDALTTTKDSIEQLKKKLSGSNLTLFIELNEKSRYLIYGDPLRLFQAITILVTNAAQANVSKNSEITTEISSTKSYVKISVKDFGKGIPEHLRKTLFEPQKSTKSAGLGIGLYVTKQIIETHFKGKLTLNPSLEYTQFTIEIPKAKK